MKKAFASRHVVSAKSTPRSKTSSSEQRSTPTFVSPQSAPGRIERVALWVSEARTCQMPSFQSGSGSYFERSAEFMRPTRCSLPLDLEANSFAKRDLRGRFDPVFFDQFGPPSGHLSSQNSMPAKAYRWPCQLLQPWRTDLAPGGTSSAGVDRQVPRWTREARLP